MSNKIISDIRLYKSEIANINGNPLPTAINDKKLNITTTRIVMKLRENEFSLGEFDHLYLNFTTCEIEGKIALAKRDMDKYHSWYRYYDINVSEELYENEDANEIISLIKKVLIDKFSSTEFNEEKIISCIEEAVTQGENMLMKFKEKKSPKAIATVFLRYTDIGEYFPLLKVTDINGNVLLNQNLPKSTELNCLGEINLSSKKVSIKPRKNVFTKDLKHLSYEF